MNEMKVKLNRSGFEGFTAFETVNPSGLEPQGHAVLVQPYEPELRRSSIIVPPSAEERNTMVETRAIVIAIGGEAWVDEKKPRAAVGDKVMMTRFAGILAIGPADGVRYRLINDRDIFCKITKEA